MTVLSAEMAVTYTITSPDGAVAKVGPPSSDPLYCGFFTEPPSGLADSPEVRESMELRTEQDGAVHGPFFEGRRPWTMQGLVLPDTSWRVRQSRLRVATRAKDRDGLLEWTSTDGQAFRCLFRRQQGSRFPDRRPRAFIVTAVNEDPRIYSGGAEKTNSVAMAAAVLSGGGFEYPASYPVDYKGGNQLIGGSMVCANAGDETTPVRLTVRGPLTGPIAVRNATAGKRLVLNTNLAAGEFLAIDTAKRTILLNGLADRFTVYDHLASRWWGLLPGNNTLELGFVDFQAGAELAAFWRDAWS